MSNIKIFPNITPNISYCTPGEESMVIEIEPQAASTSQDDTKKRSLEALFQAAKTELQHIEGQGGEGQEQTLSVVEISQVSV